MRKFRKQFFYLLFVIGHLSLVIYSYGFVNSSSPFPVFQPLYDLVNFQRLLATAIYILLITSFFSLYAWVLFQVKKKIFTAKEIWWLIGLTAVILFFSYPAFSYDVFNYLATARVSFLYRENPYLIMPIEIPNEPMLAFMHAANKTALYGPFWILLTAMPHFLGGGHLFLTIFTFKLLVLLFYLLLIYLIWRIGDRHLWGLGFFALNPLVTVQTLVDGHNDVVMMALALLAFYWLKQRRFWLAVGAFLASILIKFATLFLLPVFVWTVWQERQRRKINWPAVWRWSGLAMMLAFFLSPLREEIYAWYLIWPLTFLALLPASELLVALILAFSFGLMFRLTPFLYTASWAGTTPIIKKIVSFLPPLLVLTYWQLKRCLKRIG